MGEVVVIEGDRITLPREFREKLGIRKGDVLEYRVEDRKLVLSKTVKLDEPTKRLFGIASDVTEDLTGDALFMAELSEKLRRTR